MRYLTRAVPACLFLLLGISAYASNPHDSNNGPGSTYKSEDSGNHEWDRDERDHGDGDHRCENHERDPRDDDRDGRHRQDDNCTCKDESAAALEVDSPGVSLLSANSLLSAFSIVNTGTKRKDNVKITSINLPGATLTVPLSLPDDLGTLPAGGSVRLDADFSGGPFVPNSSYALTIRGTYSHEHERWCFKIKAILAIPPAPGSAILQTATVAPNTVTGGLFPHQPLAFEDDVNTAGWTVPTAPFVAGTPTPTATMPQIAPIGDPPAINFLVNNSLGLTSGTVTGTFSNSNSVEPSGGASGGGVVFVSANWAAAYSTDGGATFTQIDPTTIFPADAVGFCCDQIVQYVPSIDRFIWMLQGNGQRIASASPADIIASHGTAWTYWNLTPSVFNHPGSFDYPDLAVGDNYLYMSWNAGGCATACDSGHQVARTSLAGLLAGGSIEIDYTDPKNSGNAWGAHLSQNTGNEIFWAGHNSNTGLRIYSLMEGSNTYFWQDIGISTWANNSPLSSTSPDGLNWLNFLFNPTTQNPGGGFPSNAVLGSTRSFDQVWFAWSAGTDNNFQQPHVEMVTVNIDNNNPPNLSVQQQVQIWNSSYAFAYPALATNACTGEVGISMEGGGNGNYENHLVGFWGDFVAYITTHSNVGDTRYGDYVTIRQQPSTDANPGNLFSAFGYGLDSVPPPGTGTQSDVHYVLFGRPATSCQRIG